MPGPSLQLDLKNAAVDDKGHRQCWCAILKDKSDTDSLTMSQKACI